MKASNIKFSVLMSVYSKEKAEYLKMAIDSIVNQTLKPNEFIIVEDGNLTEELNECLDNYVLKYNYIKLIKLDQNVGLGRALNEGLKHCKYDYVARMDSDDISMLDRFEKQIKYLEENPLCDVVGGNIIEFDSCNNEDISRRIVPVDDKAIYNYLKKRNPMNHVTVIFKKSSVLECGSYRDCPYFEDYYLWARMINNNKKLHNIAEDLVRVRAGLVMSNRRGNFSYIKHIINFENKLLKLKLINIFGYLYNIVLRIIISLVPNSIRYNFYQKRLRNGK